MSATPSTEVPSLTFDGYYCVPADVFSLQKFREWVHGKDFPEKGRASFVVGSRCGAGVPPGRRFWDRL